MRKRLQKALDLQNNLYEIEDLAVEIKAGRMQLFECDAGICITNVLVFPRKKVLNVIAVVGEMSVIPTLQDQVIAFGKAQDCDFFFTEGRAGWKKVLPKFGWTNLPERSHLMIDLRT